jgi:hypothetical protein
MKNYDLEDINDIYEILLDYEIATGNELELVTSINGYNIETLNDIIYCRTAYRDIEQLIEYELTDLRYLLELNKE